MENGVITKVSAPVIAIALFITLILGVTTGYGAMYLNSTTRSDNNMSNSNSDSEKSDNIKSSAGIKDTKTFPDQAEGILREGGFEGEGSFHLERPGGKSQNAYLTSSAIDLSEFVGKKVRVWGATFRASKAGWLMDVGYLEVL
jgi:hypothetical protein